MSQVPHDISIRFPKSKKHLKDDLLKLSGETGFSLTQLVTYIIEDFLRRRAAGEKIQIEL